MSPAPGLEMDASLGPCHWAHVPSPVPLSPLFGPRLAPTVGFLPTQFILKHKKYQHLREVERFPNSFNPHVPDTLALLKSLLSQVMEKHRHSSWIHIGADEVGSAGPQAPPAARPAPRRAEHPLSPPNPGLPPRGGDGLQELDEPQQRGRGHHVPEAHQAGAGLHRHAVPGAAGAHVGRHAEEDQHGSPAG